LNARIAASNGMLDRPLVEFERCSAVAYGGVLLLLPFLENQGFFSYREHYKELSGYYYQDQVFLLCAFMYLCRISNPEQLKTIAPGEYGKLLGLDRIPETNCLRKKLSQINDQNNAAAWSSHLSSQWIENENPDFFYVDGHTQIYYGDQATLGKKYVARQKLCMPGVSDYYVNDGSGLPFFYVRGELNEKLLEMLKSQIIPRLLKEVPSRYSETQLEDNPKQALFTIVMDREGWQPDWFIELWETHRIAILTYRKHVKGDWDQNVFVTRNVKLKNGEITAMQLAEKDTEIQGHTFREIRKLSAGDHQTSIITTNSLLTIEEAASTMFARWSQENFFRYMRQNYDLDRLYTYQTNPLKEDLIVVNPVYAQLSHKIKKQREKTSRLKAKLMESIFENTLEPLETTPAHNHKQQKLKELILIAEEETNQLIAEREKHKPKIKLKEMPEATRYNKLEQESKLVQNLIKMICYRAETAFASQLAPHFKQSANQIRELVKSIITLNCDITPDKKENTLTITLYSLPNPRANQALANSLDLINNTQTLFPGTPLKLVFQQNSTS